MDGKEAIEHWVEAIENWRHELNCEASWGVLEAGHAALVNFTLNSNAPSLNGIVDIIKDFLIDRKIPETALSECVEYMEGLPFVNSSRQAKPIAGKLFTPPRIGDDKINIEDSVYALVQIADNCFAVQQGCLAVDISMSPSIRPFITDKTLFENNGRSLSSEPLVSTKLSSLRVFDEISGFGHYTDETIVPVVGGYYLVGCHWKDSPSLGKSTLKKNYPLYYIPCRLVFAITRRSNAMKWRGTDDLEYTFAPIIPSFSECKWFRVFSSECVVCSIPSKQNSFLCERIMAWNAAIASGCQQWTSDIWAYFWGCSGDDVISDNSPVKRIENVVNLSIGHYMDLAHHCIDLCTAWHNAGVNDSCPTATVPATNTLPRAACTAPNEESHARHGRSFRSSLRCSTQQVLPQWPLAYGGWLSHSPIMLSVNKLMRLTEELTMILTTIIEIMLTPKIEVLEEQRKFSAFGQSFLQLAVSNFLDFLPKVLAIIPTPMAITSRSWSNTLRRILDVRNVVQSLTSIVAFLKTGPEGALDISTSQIESSLKDLSHEYDQSLSNILQAFQDSVEYLIQSTFLDDISRQDWSSNTVFRKSQQLSYGITSLLLTIRGLTHDIIASCARAKLVDSYAPSIVHSGVVATICITLNTTALRSVSEFYSSLETSRIRLQQWSVDLTAVISSTVEILQFLVDTGILDATSDAQHSNRTTDCCAQWRNLGSRACFALEVPIHEFGPRSGGQSAPRIMEYKTIPSNRFNSCDLSAISGCVEVLGAAMLVAFTIGENNGQCVVNSIYEGINLGLLYDLTSGSSVHHGVQDVGIVPRKPCANADESSTSNQLGMALQISITSTTNSLDQTCATEVTSDAPLLNMLKAVSEINMEIGDSNLSPRIGDQLDLDSPRVPVRCNGGKNPSKYSLTLGDLLACLMVNTASSTEVSPTFRSWLGSMTTTHCNAVHSVSKPLLCLHSPNTFFDHTVDSARMRPNNKQEALQSMCAFCTCSRSKQSSRGGQPSIAGSAQQSLHAVSTGTVSITESHSPTTDRQVREEASVRHQQYIGCPCVAPVMSQRRGSLNTLLSVSNRHILCSRSDAAVYECGCRPSSGSIQPTVEHILAPLSFEEILKTRISPDIVKKCMSCHSAILVAHLLKRYEMKGIDSGLLAVTGTDGLESPTNTLVDSGYPKLSEEQVRHAKELMQLVRNLS